MHDGRQTGVDFSRLLATIGDALAGLRRLKEPPRAVRVAGLARMAAVRHLGAEAYRVTAEETSSPSGRPRYEHACSSASEVSPSSCSAGGDDSSDRAGRAGFAPGRHAR